MQIASDGFGQEASVFAGSPGRLMDMAAAAAAVPRPSRDQNPPPVGPIRRHCAAPSPTAAAPSAVPPVAHWSGGPSPTHHSYSPMANPCLAHCSWPTWWSTSQRSTALSPSMTLVLAGRTRNRCCCAGPGMDRQGERPSPVGKDRERRTGTEVGSTSGYRYPTGLWAVAVFFMWRDNFTFHQI